MQRFSNMVNMRTMDKIATLKSKKLFLLDMDGTLYLDETLFDGTADFLQFIRKTGNRYLFLTNNSSKSVKAYIDKMRRLGISATAEDFLTSVDALILYLHEQRWEEKNFYVCGTQSMKSQLRTGGFNIVENPKLADALLMGFDTELTFQKLEDACILLGQGVDYVATNPDWVCPTSYGYVPDCGSVCEMLYRATGRRPVLIGKPEPAMPLLAMKNTGYTPEETILIGDRLYTDIASGVNAGIDTILVLSGESKESDIDNSDVKPTFVLNNIKELLQILN